MGKRLVELEIEDRVYLGRFLGFIKNEEFCKIVGNPGVTSRISSGKTKALLDACNRLSNAGCRLNGIRLVMSAEERDGERIPNRSLLLSERLNFISQIDPRKREVCFVTDRDTQIIAREHIL